VDGNVKNFCEYLLDDYFYSPIKIKGEGMMPHSIGGDLRAFIHVFTYISL